MKKISPPDQTAPAENANGGNTQTGVGGETVSTYGSTRRPTRANNRRVNII